MHRFYSISCTKKIKYNWLITNASKLASTDFENPYTLHALFTHSSKATVKGLLNLHSDSVMFLPFIASPESKLAKTSKGWTNHQKANWTKLSEEVWIEKTPRGDLEKPPESKLGYQIHWWAL